VGWCEQRGQHVDAIEVRVVGGGDQCVGKAELRLTTHGVEAAVVFGVGRLWQGNGGQPGCWRGSERRSGM
jgi:hypothetical protein